MKFKNQKQILPDIFYKSGIRSTIAKQENVQNTELIFAKRLEDVLNDQKENFKGRFIANFFSKIMRNSYGDLYVKTQEREFSSFTQDLIYKLKSLKFIDEIIITPSFNDEPNLPLYSVKFILPRKILKKIKTSRGGGIALTKEEALLKALLEAVERRCFVFSSKKDFLYAKIDDLTGRHLDLHAIQYYLPEQLKQFHFKAFRFTKDSKFYWQKARDLFTNEVIWIPIQFFYWNYKYEKREEPRLCESNSNGEAVGFSFESALGSAILEAVERDSFMIYWLKQLVPPRIDLKKIFEEPNIKPDLKKLIYLVNRYRFDLSVLDITTDLNIPSYVGVLRDHSGVGGAVSVGAAADLDPQKAIIKSILEAFHEYKNSRFRKSKKIPLPVKAYESDLSQWSRIDLWHQREMYNEIDWFLQGKKVGIREVPSKYLIPNQKYRFNILKNILKNNNLDAYYFDATPKILNEKAGLWAIKAVIPRLVPIYLNERWPYLGPERLKTVPQKLGYQVSPGYFNPLPHPFP